MSHLFPNHSKLSLMHSLNFYFCQKSQNIKFGKINHCCQKSQLIIDRFWGFMFLKSYLYLFILFFLANCHHFPSVITNNLPILTFKYSKINNQSIQSDLTIKVYIKCSNGKTSYNDLKGDNLITIT